MQKLAFVFVLMLSACATQAGPREDPFVVVEQNAVITDRARINSTSVLDTDTLLVRVGAGEIYRIKLIPGCVDYSDIGTAAHVVETGPGIDRSTRFVIGGSTCPVRSIERVEERARVGAQGH